MVRDLTSWEDFGVMGLRKWLLGFDPDEFRAKLEELEERIEEAVRMVELLSEELDELKDVKDDVRRVEERLSELDNLINELRDVLTGKREAITTEKELSTADKYDLVLNLIKEGINTSSELRKRVPFSVRELHRILNELEKSSLIGYVKKGRTKYYYVVEAKKRKVQSKDYV